MATFKSLTKTDKKHLREMGCPTLTLFKITAAGQKEMRRTVQCEPCYQCKSIARKLGLPV
jgi:hypothetical protein